MTAQVFINELLPGAVAIQRKYGLPAAAMIAQAALETGWGKAINGNNLYNIKGTGQAGYTEIRAWEVIDGQDVSIPSRFRCYHDYQESFEDYAVLITGDPRYAQALAVRGNPVAYVEALAAAGYATDLAYASKIVSIMDDFDLIATVNDYISKSDVAGHWAQAEIKRVRKLGIMGGYDDGTFRPDQPMTRAEVAATICRLIDYLSK